LSITVAGQAIEQFGDEGMEAMGADVARGLPEDGSGRGDGGTIHARASGAGAGRPRGRDAPEQADGGLAMETGDGHDLIEELPFLRPGGRQIPLALHGRVLPQARSRHGRLLHVGVGNRDFRCTTALSVTEVLM
jgi:hypothetical protein